MKIQQGNNKYKIAFEPKCTLSSTFCKPGRLKTFKTKIINTEKECQEIKKYYMQLFLLKTFLINIFWGEIC